MNTFTFAPALGWIAGSLIAAVMIGFAIALVVVHRRRGQDGSDETTASLIRRVLMCVLIAVLALTPSWKTTTTSRAVSATDVVIATDITASMGVHDAQYGNRSDISRLDAARAAIDDITQQYANSSFAAVSFGTSGVQDVPLTPDTQAIDRWASTLRLESASTSGSSLDTVIDTLLITLKSIRDAHPDDRIVLYIITDGEQTVPRARRTFSALRRYINDACVIGVGSTSGGKIPQVQADGSTSDTNWVIDPSSGQPGVSIMDESQIKSLADELSGSALFTSSQTLADSRIAQEASKWRTTTTEKERIRYTPITWPFVSALFVVMAWELASWFIQSRRLLR